MLNDLGAGGAQEDSTISLIHAGVDKDLVGIEKFHRIIFKCRRKLG